MEDPTSGASRSTRAFTPSSPIHHAKRPRSGPSSPTCTPATETSSSATLSSFTSPGEAASTRPFSFPLTSQTGPSVPFVGHAALQRGLVAPASVRSAVPVTLWSGPVADCNSPIASIMAIRALERATAIASLAPAERRLTAESESSPTDSKVIRSISNRLMTRAKPRWRNAEWSILGFMGYKERFFGGRSLELPLGKGFTAMGSPILRNTAGAMQWSRGFHLPAGFGKNPLGWVSRI